ncbi:MAG: RNA polymerase sigma-70 factor [Muribaculaceae bacterium]|nr:RNA polymerase sigma-70 factor [Muribaculaceae bacterium]
MTRGELTDCYRRFYRPLGMYALKLLGDVDEAEDIVQEIFGTLVDRSDDISSATVKPYLYRAVHNRVLNRLRDSMGERLAEYPDEVTEEDIDTSERDARLWEEIGQLPQRCREVFLMAKRDGMSYAEIAEELGISVKTVENQMTKALSRLREALSARKGRKVFFLPFLV